MAKVKVEVYGYEITKFHQIDLSLGTCTRTKRCAIKRVEYNKERNQVDIYLRSVTGIQPVDNAPLKVTFVANRKYWVHKSVPKNVELPLVDLDTLTPLQLRIIDILRAHRGEMFCVSKIRHMLDHDQGNFLIHESIYKMADAGILVVGSEPCVAGRRNHRAIYGISLRYVTDSGI